MAASRWTLLKRVVGVLIVALVAAAPLLVDDRFMLKVFTFVGINAVIVIGLAILFGFAGQVSLGHAGFVGLGAYVSAYMTTRMHAPWPVAILTAALVAATGGLLLALPSLRLRGHYLAMATLGFGEIMYIAFVEAEPITGGTNGFTGIPFPSVGAFQIREPAHLYWLVWGIVGIAAVLSWNALGLRPGRAFRAMHGSELGALACGVDLTSLKVQAFAISAMLAGVAGSLYAHVVGFISPSSFTLHVSIMLVAMAVVGGSGSLVGPLLATVALTLLQHVGSIAPGMSREVAEVVQDWSSDIYGIAIILVMIFAPTGIAGLLKPRTGRKESDR